MGVSIQLFVRKKRKEHSAQIHYAAVTRDWTKEQKYQFLDTSETISTVNWTAITPDVAYGWLTGDIKGEFEQFLPLGDKATKGKANAPTVFALYSLGVNTNRDAWAYNYQQRSLEKNIENTVDFYNAQLAAWVAETGGTGQIERAISSDETKISWSEGLKNYFKRRMRAEFDQSRIRPSLYRPFAKRFLYYDAQLNERRYQMPLIFPPQDSRSDNTLIWVKTGTEVPMFALATNVVPNLLPQGGSQCFPFYTYAEDGTHRRENITDWALDQFRSHYADPSISKWDIFHYVYAILHHPDYRQRYAANLRRELPRIPFAGATGAKALDNASPDAGINPGSSTATRDVLARTPGVNATVEERPLRAASGVKKENNTALPKAVAGGQSPQATSGSGDRGYPKLSEEERKSVPSEIKKMQDAGELQPLSQADLRVFRAFAKAGQRLAEIHVHYEQQPEYPLKKVEKKGEQLDYRVEKMKLSKDKTQLIYNNS